jgi:hypothetical protein
VWFSVALTLASTSIRANDSVAIRATSEELTTLARRVGSELVSAGYSVRFANDEPAPGCDASSAETLWISIAESGTPTDEAIATLCFRGLAATVKGPRADPARFAVAAAEALNGLRAQPVAATEPPSRPTAARADEKAPLADAAGARRTRHARPALMLAESLIVDVREFPVLWGTSLDVQVPLSQRVQWVVDGFVPVTRAELSSSEAELRAGLAYLRSGLALHQTLGELGVGSSVTGGAALMWVKADAKAPRVGGSATALGAIASVGIQLSYPERETLFVLSRARATLLLPAGRFVVPAESSSTLGPLLFEASLGLGVRL